MGRTAMSHEIEKQSVKLCNKTIRGGPCNVHLVRCAPVELTSLRLIGPAGDGATDEHGKNILCDQCASVWIERCRCEGAQCAGDGINLYRCADVTIRWCVIRGLRRNDDVDIAAGIVVDEGSHNVLISSCQIEVPEPLAAIVIVGCNVDVIGCHGTGPIQIGLDGTRCYVGIVEISRWTGPQPYVAPDTIGQVWLNGKRIYCQR